MTEFERAKSGDMSPDLRQVARDEGMEPERMRLLVAEGRAVITGARREGCRAIGIGEGLKTKVNANIGTSPDHDDIEIGRIALG